MKKLSFILSAALFLFLSTAHAANLMTVYHQALLSDPTFKQAQAQYLSAKEDLALALSGNGAPGTGVFPNIDVGGEIGKNFQAVQQTPPGPDNVDNGLFNEDNVAINIDQPLFNAATWKGIKGARYTVRAATATYLAAAQQLMDNVANGYFAVLRANDTLMLTLAQKEQFKHQLITEEQKFKVGLIAITGVYDAKASYDRSIADEVNDRNNLHDQLENLRAITGRFYSKLSGLKPTIPLIIPRPRNIEAWVRVADKQNYLIQADINNMLASHEAVKQSAVSWWPTVDLQLIYTRNTSGNLFGGVRTNLTEEKQAQLAVDFPVFRGGFDFVNTRQARFNYLAVSDQLEIDHRNVVNETRQSYLGVESGISQIKADEQAIISARNQLAATRAGYIVGTRTMVDVLDSVTKLTQAQQAYANDRYDYVLSIVRLQQQAGILSPKNLQQVNGWLGKAITFDLKQPTIKESSSFDYRSVHRAPSELLKINNPRDTAPTTPEGKPVEPDMQSTPHSQPFKKIMPTPEVPKNQPNFRIPLKSNDKKTMLPVNESSTHRLKHLSNVLGHHPTYRPLPKPAEHKTRIAKPHQTLTPPHKTRQLLQPTATHLHKVAERVHRQKISHKKITRKAKKTSHDPVSFAVLNKKREQLIAQKQTHHKMTRQYSIVLFSDRSPVLARDFIKTNKLDNKARVANVEHGKYMGFKRVLMGNYTSYAAAKKALTHLPISLRRYHPWIK